MDGAAAGGDGRRRTWNRKKRRKKNRSVKEREGGKGSILNTSSSTRSDGRSVFTLWRATKITVFIFTLCKGQKWSYNIERVHVFAIMQGHFHVLPRPTHLSSHTQLKRNTAFPYWSHQHRASPRLVARIHSTSEPDYPLPQKSRWEGRYSSSLQLPAPLHSLCHVNDSTPHSCEPKMHTKQVQLTENMAYLHQPCSYIGVEVNMWNRSTQRQVISNYKYNFL